MLFHSKGGSFCKVQGRPPPASAVCLSSIHNYGKVSWQHTDALSDATLSCPLIGRSRHRAHTLVRGLVFSACVGRELKPGNAADSLIVPRSSSFLISKPIVCEQYTE